jgi:hypothetical protein
VSAPVVHRLTPLESLCLTQVQFWVGVVERNQGRCGRLVDGRPFTRLPAQELVENLEERFPFLAVTVRQVRSALNKLVSLGLLVREQFWQRERWRSDYWYSLPETRDDRDVTPESPQLEQRSDKGVTPSLKPLPSSLPEKTNGPNGKERTTTSSEPTDRQPNSIDNDGDPRGVQEAQEQPSRPRGVVSHFKAGSDSQGVTGTSQRPARRFSGVNAIIERCLELAGLPPTATVDLSTLEPVSPRGVVVGGRLLRVDDGPTAPLR